MLPVSDPTERSQPAAPNLDTDPTRTSAHTPNADDAGTIPTPPGPPNEPHAVPVMLGGRRVVKLLGQCGMGAVPAAEDIALRRPVALETMKTRVRAGGRGPAGRLCPVRRGLPAGRAASAEGGPCKTSVCRGRPPWRPG